MHPLHLEKTGLRGLAIAESFQKNDSQSVLVGVVMRKDLQIDGFVIGKSTLSGNDSTEEILNMYGKLHRTDINYILISGVIISLYNIVDLQRLYDVIKIPVIGISYDDSEGIDNAIKKHFPSSFESVLEKYHRLPKREKIILYTEKELYVRSIGCSTQESKKLLDSLVIQGSIPEPIRVAQLLAHVILNS